MVRLYLASRSPRRRKLLAGLGYGFALLDAAVDETRAAGEAPSHYVERLAREKALAGFGLASRDPTVAGNGPVRLAVVGADTAVAVDGRVLGKPRDEAEILRHLEWLSGRAHDVLSAMAVVSGHDAASSRVELRLCPSKVWFRTLSVGECKAYRATGKPADKADKADKAGRYAIQGLAAAFVTRLEGSWSAVVGLPVAETIELLGRAGVPFL